MEKKVRFFGGLIVALALVLVVAGGAYAYTYMSAQLSQNFSVQEPIEAQIISTSKPEGTPVFPGEPFTTTFEVRNLASIAYGMEYGGNIYLDWGYGSAEKETEAPMKFSLADQPVENGVIRLEKTAGGETLGCPSCFYPFPAGTVDFELDLDGPGENGYQSYTAWQTINLPPEGIHWIRAVVRPSANIAPTNWQVYFWADRGEPAP
ncbi:hypothetical protein KKB68_02525 [Patescibacteria group bacterium]|nr:hypothetical protein [Patescibacteria group bacterium]